MSTWTPDYGTWVLFIACVFAWIAVLFIRHYDHYEQERKQRMERWQPTSEQIERSKR